MFNKTILLSIQPNLKGQFILYLTSKIIFPILKGHSDLKFIFLPFALVIINIILMSYLTLSFFKPTVTFGFPTLIVFR